MYYTTFTEQFRYLNEGFLQGCKIKKIMNIISVTDIIVIDYEIVKFRVFFLNF